VGVTHVADRRKLFELVHRVREAAAKSIQGKADGATAVTEPEPEVVDESEEFSLAKLRSLAGSHLSRMEPSPPPPAVAVRFIEDLSMRKDAWKIAQSADMTLAFFRRWSAIVGLDEAPVEAPGEAPSPPPPEEEPSPPVVEMAEDVSPPPPAPRASDAPESVLPPSGFRHAGARPDGQVFDRDGFLVEPRKAVKPLRASAATAAAAATASAGEAVVDEAEIAALDSGDGPKIRVVVRKRPLNRREARRGELDVVETVSRRTLLMHEGKQKVDLTRYTETHAFSFDDVYDHTCSTETVYRHAARPLVASVFRGGKATVFAYGQTGSGKTHSMLGTPTAPGLYVLAARDIFQGLSLEKFSFLRACVSFYEIYGGKLYDLLNGRTQLRALADANEAVVVKGLSEQGVSSVEALMRVIDFGMAARSTGSTGANADSSRSHAILSIVLRDSRSGKPHGKYSFIDLAGSERGADTTHTDRRTRLEGAEINKSLLALKECIRSLYQEHDHLPFRGSKLTQVLRDSFVGDSRTVMIATISPNSSNCEHSLNTLRYAYRVKEIRRDDSDAPDTDAPHGTGAPNPYAFRDVMSRRGAPSGPRADFDEAFKFDKDAGASDGEADSVDSEDLAGREGQRPAIPAEPLRERPATADLAVPPPSKAVAPKAVSTQPSQAKRRAGGRTSLPGKGAVPAPTLPKEPPRAKQADGDDAVRRRVMSKIPRSAAPKPPVAEAPAPVKEPETDRPEPLARVVSDGWLPATPQGPDPASFLPKDIAQLVTRHREQVVAMMTVLQEELALVTDPEAISKLGARAYVDRVEVLLGEKLFLIDGMGHAVSEIKSERGWMDDDDDDDHDDEGEAPNDENRRDVDAKTSSPQDDDDGELLSEQDEAPTGFISPPRPRPSDAVAPLSAGSSVAASPAALLIT
jgi:hypothetical protein